jgi:hypothetical protein
MQSDPAGVEIVAPGEGHRLEARGSEMFFKAVARNTRGRFSLMERTLPAGGRMPPPHVHVDMEEAYFVLDGEVTFIAAVPDVGEMEPLDVRCRDSAGGLPLWVAESRNARGAWEGHVLIRGVLRNRHIDDLRGQVAFDRAWARR